MSTGGIVVDGKPISREELRREVEDVVREVFREIGFDVAKYGGAAALGAVLVFLAQNRDKLMSILARRGGADEFQSRLGERSTIRSVIEEIIEERIAKAMESQPSLEQLESERDAIVKEIDNLRDKYALGKISKEEYEKRVRELENRLIVLNYKIDELMQENP